MTETDLQRLIQLDISGPYCRPLRNNVGQGWQGNTFSIVNGNLVSGSARRVVYGLSPGSSDLIGPTSVLIMPNMIGQRVAIFTAIECKGERTRATDEQRAFIAMVRQLGGFAGIAKSVDDARQIVTGVVK
mgnify:CR=1 FL=1